MPKATRWRSIAPANLDKFSHTGVLSGGSIAVTNITDMTAFKEEVRLVFVSYGSCENGATGKANVEALRQAGIKSVCYGPITNGRRGDAACANSRRCCLTTDAGHGDD